MLFLKRLVTTLTLFVVFFVTFWIGAIVIVSGTAGARAAKNQEGRDYASDYAAGAEAQRKYGHVIFLSTISLAAVSALGLTFSGVLSWTRKKPEAAPPPIG